MKKKSVLQASFLLARVHKGKASTGECNTPLRIGKASPGTKSRENRGGFARDKVPRE